MGNQSIQIPFVQKLHQPQLYGRDVMVEQTIGRYPSYFYNGVAWLLNFGDLPTVYLLLHLLTAAGALAAGAWMVRAMFRRCELLASAEAVGLKLYGPAGAHWSAWAGLVLMLMLLSGQHMTLGGDGLYSTGFSHTWAAFAIGLGVLALFYADRYFWAFLLAGLLFNLHALEAAYLAAFMGLATLMSIRRLGWWRVIGWWVLFVLASGPALVVMFAMRQHYDGLWMMLMHARSAVHSFPSSWWEVGNPDVPRFALMIGMGAAAMGLIPHPLTEPAPDEDDEERALTGTAQRRVSHLRKTQWIAVAAGLMFAAGYLFTEVWPSALVVRAQLFRCSRFIEVIALAYVAGGCVRAWWGVIQSWRGRAVGLKSYGLGVEAIVMTCGVLCLSLPALMPMLPWVVLAAGLVALIHGRLSWYAAVVVSAALLVGVIAHQRLHFVIPGFSPDFAWGMLIDLRLPGWWALVAIAAGVMMWIAATRCVKCGEDGEDSAQDRGRPWAGLVVAVLGVAGAAAIIVSAWGTWISTGGDGDWIAAQHWAERNTPTDALFLTPPQNGGFRMYSKRSVVGEWRDGTQLYFSAAFTQPWWDRMTAVQPGLLYNDSGRMVKAGRMLAQMDDEQLMAMAHTLHADYVVLPVGKVRWMEQVYTNDRWAIYRPRIPTPKPGAEAMAAQRRFIDQTVEANIRKNRMTDVRVQVVDDAGRPIADAKYQIEQIHSAFRFGATLGPIKPMPDDMQQGMDYVQHPATDAQLAAFTNVFNFTVTGITGTWLQIENQRGKTWYDDTDAYVDWCEKHGVPVELHFVSGYEPVWVMRLKPEQRTWERMRHARQMIERYGNRIAWWEVIDDGVGQDEAAMLFAMIRKQLPDAKLGIGACVRFSSDAPPAVRERDMWRGLELVRELNRKGVKVDFVSFHAHRPWGVWADARLIEQTIEMYVKEGVRIHISQLGVPDHGPIGGAVRQGDWTPELAAEYYRDVMKVCFSEPGVDAINFEGLAADTLTAGAGLLDEQDRPKPAYEAIKQLITHDWRTAAGGQLGLDGAARFRGFYGGYRLTVTLGDGREISAPFDVKAEGENHWRFVLDEAKQALEVRP